ncbi:ACP S-malonyltransferase [Parachlamydia sp. AcF125]|uniref:ACP S-malonyltransferase n=1 Tax=Parachlamydia sp. AcF125 TaxID=2795736 RepID=UPI001BD8155B|nr:ACP S-malonyltransferase [Parachlamydia sp. AcF125]MBS4169188.1 Malonyl CoA-acyl carrier protein transacylase [Parachlamydia sp. AcF125]
MISPKLAFIFPGQGSQYPGMGKEFIETFPLAKQIFEEADDRLKRNLSRLILEGPEAELTETKNSQAAIYVTSYAILRCAQQEYPHLQPSFCAGLSLGEYTAATAAGNISFADGLALVQSRGQFMNDACEKTAGSMAVVLGLNAEAVEELVSALNLPNDLWVANYNCPGQVVISGTLKGIEAGSNAAKTKGAKRILPLQVHGAFHSGLMWEAEQRLAEHVRHAPLMDSPVPLVMNVTGSSANNLAEIRLNLIRQVTHSVRWQQGIEHICKNGIDQFIEFGCGKTLAGFNKRIGVPAPTLSIETLADLKSLAESFC